jgi:FtsH-binding integral membrane protein
VTSRRPASRRARRRISPGVVFLVVALVASIAYTAYAITVREASQIPLLASGAVVLGLTFGALAVYCLRAILRAGRAGRGGRALLLALVGGFAAITAAGALAAAFILFQLVSSGG